MTGKRRWGLLVAVLVLALGLLAEAPAVDASSGQAPPAEGGGGTWRQVSAGYYHTCAIKLDGHLFCWGQDSRSQLGNGGANTNVSQPTEVSGGTADWKSVSAGSAWTCAIKVNGTLWCWGRDDFGQLGNGPGSSADQSVPVQVGTATDWKSVSAGLGETTCGRRANRRIYCWGKDDNGQVGNGPATSTPVTSPTAVGTSADWSSVSTGGYHVCGRRSNGRVYCWGDDQDGAVGDGGTVPGVDRSVPTQVAGAHADWTAVTSGITHSCGRRASGRLYCWGSDIWGGLGNGAGSSTSKPSPGEVKGGATDWKAVSAGSYVTCATKVSGRLFCWGDDFYGQVGTGLPDRVQDDKPVQVSGNLTTWRPAVIGNGHTCALRTDNRLFCWGYGFFGQRGEGVSGNNDPQPVPVEVV